MLVVFGFDQTLTLKHSVQYIHIPCAAKVFLFFHFDFDVMLISKSQSRATTKTLNLCTPMRKCLHIIIESGIFIKQACMFNIMKIYVFIIN